MEHLVSPFPLLKDIKANKLVVSIPLRLWFIGIRAQNRYDRHYTIEDWQFDWLLENQAGKLSPARIYQSGKNRPPTLAAFIHSRYYLVYAERIV